MPAIRPIQRKCGRFGSSLLRSPLAALPMAVLNLTLALHPACGQEVVVYDNGAPDQRNSSSMTYYIAVDAFSLSAPVTFQSVRFWSVETGGSGYVGPIHWQIYADSSGLPGALLQSGDASADRTATGRTILIAGDYTEHENEFSVGSITLGPGTYWLGLHNGPLSYVPDGGLDPMGWETTAWTHSPTGLILWPDGSHPYPAGPQNAFQFISVPEPSTGALIGVVVGALVTLRWRREWQPRVSPPSRCTPGPR
jgi:hypothetical protein